MHGPLRRPGGLVTPALLALTGCLVAGCTGGGPAQTRTGQPTSSGSGTPRAVPAGPQPAGVLRLSDLPAGWTTTPADGTPSCYDPLSLVLLQPTPPATSQTGPPAQQPAPQQQRFAGPSLGQSLAQLVLVYPDAAAATTAVAALPQTVVDRCEAADETSAGGVTSFHLSSLPAPRLGDDALGVNVAAYDAAGFLSGAQGLVVRRGARITVLSSGGPVTARNSLDPQVLSRLLGVAADRLGTSS